MSEPRTSYVETATHEHRTAGSIERGLRAMAIGRIALGAGSLVAPTALARLLGIASSGELTYLTRVFGGRAIALGAAYLLADDAGRTRLQRLCVGVDISDTVDGAGHLVRGDVPRRAMVPMVLLTGSYAVVGVARLVTDRWAARDAEA